MFWYEDEVKRLEELNSRTEKKDAILFYGSSSIRLWSSLSQDFPQQKVINLGFGGSTLAACAWFFERIMVSYQPKMIIFYGGDNDLGDGRHPEEVLLFFQALVHKVRARFGMIPFVFLSIKPSPSRWHIVNQIKFTNQIIEQEIQKGDDYQYFINLYDVMLGPDGKPNATMFEADALHLSPMGYQCWQRVIHEFLVQQYL
jgi:lysophospholipase L1-like esterase